MEEGDPSDDKLYVILRGSVGVYVRGPNWSKMHEKEIQKQREEDEKRTFKDKLSAQIKTITMMQASPKASEKNLENYDLQPGSVGSDYIRRWS